MIIEMKYEALRKLKNGSEAVIDFIWCSVVGSWSAPPFYCKLLLGKLGPRAVWSGPLPHVMVGPLAVGPACVPTQDSSWFGNSHMLTEYIS